jgi:alanyl-tRNA synthetase
VPDKIERLSEQVRALQDELAGLKAKAATAAAGNLVDAAERGVLVARHDGLGTAELRKLAVETVRALKSGVVVLGGARRGQGGHCGRRQQGPRRTGRVGRRHRETGGGVCSAVASAKAPTRSAGGGQKTEQVDAALELAREQAAAWQQ